MLWRKVLVCLSVALAGIFCLSKADAWWQSRDSNYNVSVSGGSTSGWCGLIPAQGNLVNCWPFDTAHTTFNGSGAGSPTDVVGGSNAVLTNVAANGSGPSSNLNNAGSCNGSTSKGLTALTTYPTTNLTVSFWVYPAATTSSLRPFAAGNPGTTGMDYLLNTSGTAAVIIGNGSTSANVTIGYNFGFPNLLASAWNMVTWT